MSPFWVVLFVVTVGLLVLMKNPPNIPPILKRLLSVDIPIHKSVKRIVFWVFVVAVVVWLIRDLDDTLRHHYFCERQPEALTCPQEGDTPESP